MPAASIVEVADRPAAEPFLLTIGRAGVLSSRAITAGGLETLLRLLRPLPERQRRDLKRATEIVLIENGAVIYWPRTGEQFHIRDAAYAIARVHVNLCYVHALEPPEDDPGELATAQAPPQRGARRPA
jgi:hypothetical protein